MKEIRHLLNQHLSLLVIAAISAIVVQSAWSSSKVDVSQRGRMFNPGEVALRRGDTLHIVNNDGDLVHHAYVESETFSFDSGEQQPGQSADITFTKPGAFTVLCGVHPKMKLSVVVK